MAEEKKGYNTEGYSISDIYQGGYSSLIPPSDTYITAGSLGMTTDPRTANILQEVSTKLSSGVKHIEVEAVTPEIFDTIPKQQLKEVHRLSKLTGIDVSIHAPVMNVSGIDPRSGYSEAEREMAERKVSEILKRARELSPDGNIPVNFHSGEGIPGSQFLPPSEREKLKSKYKNLIVVNRETGRLAPLQAETKYYPGEKLEKGRYETPEKRLRILNESEWDNSLNQVFFNQERAQEILGKNQVQIQHLLSDIDRMKKEGVSDRQIFETLSPEQKHVYNNFISASNYIQDIHQQVNGLFSKAYEFGTEEQKNYLKGLSEEFKSVIQKEGNNPFTQAEAMKSLTNELKSIIPEMYVPIEEFAVEKSSATFGNAAYKAYKELKGKNVPMMVIENPPAGFALSTGKDIKNIVEASRKKFIESAVADGMSKSSAEREAEKLIGATWDVGHINMLRKYGYSEKEIIKETEEVAPYLKHVHLSDNFGFEHTELPMGMGNVPLKEMMEKLGQKGFDARKIVEASGWWQHWRTPPFQETLEAVGSPVYSMKMAPYWSQAAGLYQGYLSGFGQMLPEGNYNIWGSGFSMASLPTELGGTRPGAAGSRMSGRQME